jgi:alpha-tubulin suppressor-like RCC1 family protein
MSTINVSNLIITLQQKIDSSNNEADLLYYSKAMQQLKTGHIFSVDSLSQLPDAALNVGYLYYVKEDETIYFAPPDSSNWLRIYSLIFSPLFSWGSNVCGLLGDGTTINRCSPVREICSATDWCQVGSGSFHTAAVKTSGQIWTWGSGASGRLGDGTAVSRCSPVREFCSARNWCQVSAGTVHTSAIKTDGSLWSWGSDCNGVLGRNVGSFDTCSPVREFCSDTNWCQVSTSSYSVGAVKTSGQIWTWGCNVCGGLGDGNTVTRTAPVREISSSTNWCQLSVGAAIGGAVKTSGEIWTWGRNDVGQLGDGTITSRCSPVRERSSSTDWCQVSAGTSHSAAIKTTGQIWSWGYGGRLGDGTTVNRCSPVREFCSATDWCQVSTGSLHTVAVKTTGQLWAWGSTIYGRLGDGAFTTQFTIPAVCRCSPVREITSSTNWCLVSTNGAATIGLKSIEV